jgi:hypothetical protein
VLLGLSSALAVVLSLDLERDLSGGVVLILLTLPVAWAFAALKQRQVRKYWERCEREGIAL